MSTKLTKSFKMIVRLIKFVAKWRPLEDWIHFVWSIWLENWDWEFNCKLIFLSLKFFVWTSCHRWKEIHKKLLNSKREQKHIRQQWVFLNPKGQLRIEIEPEVDGTYLVSIVNKWVFTVVHTLCSYILRLIVVSTLNFW